MAQCRVAICEIEALAPGYSHGLAPLVLALPGAPRRSPGSKGVEKRRRDAAGVASRDKTAMGREVALKCGNFLDAATRRVCRNALFVCLATLITSGRIGRLGTCTDRDLCPAAANFVNSNHPAHLQSNVDPTASTVDLQQENNYPLSTFSDSSIENVQLTFGGLPTPENLITSLAANKLLTGKMTIAWGRWPTGQKDLLKARYT